MADERGAIVALVAVMLVAILGMTALVIDVGGALVTKRHLVAAADSASLAAAQSCAKEEGDFNSQADEYAAGNLEGASGTVTPIGCESPELGGSVAVNYNADHELYFASTLPGVGDSTSVDASATALWGPALTAEPIPVALNLAGHPRTTCAEACSFWLDASNDEGFAGGAGLVALDRWDGGRCRGGNPNRVLGWISGSGSVEVSAPATPCALTFGGDLVEELVGQIGQDKVFPVADDGTSVSGFAPLRIVDAVATTEAVSDEECDDQPDDHDFAGPGDTYPINDEVLACLLDKGADSVGVELSGSGNCCSQPGDYVLDANNVITWRTEETKNVEIEISWSRLPDSGGCPNEVISGNEICLVLSWQGPRVSGSKPAEDGTTDYGYRAVRLKD